MIKREISTLGLSSIIFIFALLILVANPSESDAATAKQRYLEADNCHKKLRNSAKRKQYASEWLHCIGKYEVIHRIYPESAWAPAGMYKACELYLSLYRISGQKTYRVKAIDLLQRLQNHYPSSAYASKARWQLKKLSVSSKTIPVRHKNLKSLKYKTAKWSKIKAFTRRELKKIDARKIAEQKRAKEIAAKEAERKKREEAERQRRAATGQLDIPAASQADYSGSAAPRNGTVTDLRFWSNPEYTRIVVNADQESEYSHRLLKRDPEINKPFQRLYIDIEQARLGKGVAEHTPINDNLLRQARAGQYLPHTVRVVVDIKSFENYKIFSLKDPFRIVIDVWGKGSNGSPAKGKQVAGGKTQPPKEKPTIISTDDIESSDIARQLALGVRKIVIDPGHGGADPGAPGYYKNIWEKDIVLQLAKKLAVVLRDRLKCTVVLTRTKDRKLTLEERTAIANTERADLFISLHCNAARNKRLRGIETYFLNLATDEQAIAVAARENAISKKDIGDLDYILTDLLQHAKVEESTRLATVVQSSFFRGLNKKYGDIKNLGVKQAPFYVLLGARMPSILIETSFISNKKDCKRLMSSGYQTTVANSIADGIEKYIEHTNPKQL